MGKFPIFGILAFFLFCSVSEASPAQYYVGPNGNDSDTGDRSHPFKSIAKGISAASAGDSVVLMPGKYPGVITIAKSGLPEKPITIISDSHDEEQFAVIDGGYPEGWDEYFEKPGMPTKGSKNYGIVIEDASWIVIENITFRNCYNVGISLNNSSYITIRGCNIYGAGYAIYCSGKGTHHILVENNYWESMPNDALFEQLEFGHVKRGNIPGDPYKYMAQGSMFADYQGGGGSVIRYNKTDNCFQSLRLQPPSIQEGDNIEIYGNNFGRSLDNVYEPEKYVFNQHFYHNVLVGWKGSMTVSIHGVAGGPLYFYGNICYGGRLIWKLAHPPTNGPYFTDIFHCYHNTFHNGEGVNHDREFKHWHHYNNIYLMRMGMRNWPPDMMSQVDNLFDYDCITESWPSVITNDGQEEHGLANTDPRVISASRRDYRLSSDSPCIDRGKVIEGFTQSYQGKAPDIGAYEGDKLIEGPPFRIMIPPGGLLYKEKPRITRHRVKGNELTLFFSWPLDPGTVTKDIFHIQADGAVVDVTNAILGTSNCEIKLSLGENVDGKTLALRMNPLPVGGNGESATHWASTLPLSTSNDIGQVQIR